MADVGLLTSIACSGSVSTTTAPRPTPTTTTTTMLPPGVAPATASATTATLAPGINPPVASASTSRWAAVRELSVRSHRRPEPSVPSSCRAPSLRSSPRPGPRSVGPRRQRRGDREEGSEVRCQREDIGGLRPADRRRHATPAAGHRRNLKRARRQRREAPERVSVDEVPGRSEQRAGLCGFCAGRTVRDRPRRSSRDARTPDIPHGHALTRTVTHPRATHGIQEVEGSTPFGSTRPFPDRPQGHDRTLDSHSSGRRQLS